jgi:hypothetical protein
MTIKKMLVLLGAAMALVAFAAPAVAQADQWYTDHEGQETLLGGSTAEADEVELTGDLTSTSGGLAVTCTVHAIVDLWNENGAATGEVTTFTITAPSCKSNIDKFGCTIKNAGPIGLSWHVDVETGEGGIVITEAGFFNEYTGANCALVGIPTGVQIPASGDATGTWNGTTHCIDFNESGDLEGAKGEVILDGSICGTSPTTTLTLK